MSWMMKINPRHRPSLYQVLEHTWVNRGFLSPPLDYMEYPKRERNAVISFEWVDKLLKSNVCDSGCILMGELKQRMPKPEIKVEPRDNSSRECVDEVEDLALHDKQQGKVWWRRLMKKMSKIHERITTRETMEEGETSQVPLLTRLLRRRVATASAFQSIKVEPSIPLKTKVRTETETPESRPTQQPASRRWLPNLRRFTLNKSLSLPTENSMEIEKMLKRMVTFLAICTSIHQMRDNLLTEANIWT